MQLTIWDVGLFILSLSCLFLYYAKRKITYFEKNGIKTLPAYPVLGNMTGALTGKEHFMNFLFKAYTSFPDEKYIGVYYFQKPMILIKDLDLIKQITIKDFDHFQDHPSFLDDDMDPIFGKNLLALKGQKWRDMRATLSPAFTSSKMKNMFAYVAECGELMAKYYLKKMQETENQQSGLMEIEIKDAFTKYANDVIATSAFGIKVDSLNEPDNEFYKLGKQATQPGFMFIIKTIGLMMAPRLMKMLNVSLFGKTLSNSFRKLVTDQMNNREKNNIIRPDMIHLLMEAKKGALKHEKSNDVGNAEYSAVEESSLGQQQIKRNWSDDELIAQAVLFFFAGFDTSSTLLSFMTHELTINPDVKKKLQDEIDKLSDKCNGKPSYNEILNMKYMDMVVSETLRKWPPGGFTDRECVKTYKLPATSSNGNGYQINVKDGVWIPIYCIHRDPKYYNNPEEFNPERFSDENKSLIQPSTYLPFGSGPRNCIGSRFALMEIKSVMFHMMSKFDFVETAKTVKPLILSKKAFNMTPEDGFWIGLKSR